MLDTLGILRKVGSSLNQRRRANYLTVLAYAPSSLTNILLRPPYNMPEELLNKLKAEHDLQSVVRRLGIDGIHFDCKCMLQQFIRQFFSSQIHVSDTSS